MSLAEQISMVQNLTAAHSLQELQELVAEATGRVSALEACAHLAPEVRVELEAAKTNRSVLRWAWREAYSADRLESALA